MANLLGTLECSTSSTGLRMWRERKGRKVAFDSRLPWSEIRRRSVARRKAVASEARQQRVGMLSLWVQETDILIFFFSTVKCFTASSSAG